MNYYYLKAVDEDTFWADMQALNLAELATDPEGEPQWRYTGPGSLNLVGTIYQPTGDTIVDAEGVEVPEMAPIPGYHANVASPTAVDFGPLAIPDPASPVRKWAGQP